jgi:hypothetical protein
MTDAEIRDSLPERDADYLLPKMAAGAATVTRIGTEIHVLFKNYQFPAGLYVPAQADLLVRLIPPYPNASPDMFWTSPTLRRSDGQMPQGCEVMQVPAPGGHEAFYDGVNWQRWSRHPDQGQWRKDIDGLRSYMGSIKMELQRGR